MKSESTRKKMSVSAKKRCTKEWREKASLRLRSSIDELKLKSMYEGGYTQEECAKELGVGRKAIQNAMKRLGIKTRIATKRNQWGNNNTGWKGSEASIICKHRRLYRVFGQPCKCSVCGTSDESKTYDWANLTGNYDDPLDFMRMCRSCHRLYDNKRRREGE